MVTQGMGPYSQKIKQVEEDITKIMKKVNDLTGKWSYLIMVTINGCRCVGVKESDTGIAVPALWDLAADKQALHQEEPLQVCFVLPWWCSVVYQLLLVKSIIDL